MQRDANIPKGQQPPTIVFWVVWAALIFSVFAVQFSIGGGLPLGKNADGATLSPIVFVAICQVMVSTAIRWVVIPRYQHPQQLLIMMVIGLALSEAAAYFGVLLIPQDQPQTRLLLLVLALAGMAQFAPIYVRPKPAPTFP